MRTVTEAVGSRGATLLWVRLMEQQAADPAALQWLPVLACWLSDSATHSPASEPGVGAMHHHESASQPAHPAQQAAEAARGPSSGGCRRQGGSAS